MCSFLDKTRSYLSGAIDVIKRRGTIWLDFKAAVSLSALRHWVIEHPYRTIGFIMDVAAVLIRPVPLHLVKLLATVFCLRSSGVVKGIGVCASHFCDDILIDYRFLCHVGPDIGCIGFGGRFGFEAA